MLPKSLPIFAFAAIVRVANDMRARRRGQGGGVIGGSIIDDNHLVDLGQSPRHDLGDARRFVECGNDR